MFMMAKKLFLSTFKDNWPQRSEEGNSLQVAGMQIVDRSTGRLDKPGKTEETSVVLSRWEQVTFLINGQRMRSRTGQMYLILLKILPILYKILKKRTRIFRCSSVSWFQVVSKSVSVENSDFRQLACVAISQSSSRKNIAQIVLTS